MVYRGITALSSKADGCPPRKVQIREFSEKSYMHPEVSVSPESCTEATLFLLIELQTRILTVLLLSAEEQKSGRAVPVMSKSW